MLARSSLMDAFEQAGRLLWRCLGWLIFLFPVPKNYSAPKAHALIMTNHQAFERYARSVRPCLSFQSVYDYLSFTVYAEAWGENPSSQNMIDTLLATGFDFSTLSAGAANAPSWKMSFRVVPIVFQCGLLDYWMTSLPEECLCELTRAFQRQNVYFSPSFSKDTAQCFLDFFSRNLFYSERGRYV